MTDIIETAQMHRALRRQMRANNDAIAQLRKDNSNIKRILKRLDKIGDGDNSARSGLGKDGWVLKQPFWQDDKPKKKQGRKRRKAKRSPKKEQTQKP